MNGLTKGGMLRVRTRVLFWKLFTLFLQPAFTEESGTPENRFRAP